MQKQNQRDGSDNPNNTRAPTHHKWQSVSDHEPKAYRHLRFYNLQLAVFTFSKLTMPNQNRNWDTAAFLKIFFEFIITAKITLDAVF